MCKNPCPECKRCMYPNLTCFCCGKFCTCHGAARRHRRKRVQMKEAADRAYAAEAAIRNKPIYEFLRYMEEVNDLN